LQFIDNPWFYAVAIPAVLLTGVSKGGFAGAFSGLAVPMLALVISPVQAAGVMLPVLLLTDLFGLTQFWRRANFAVIATMVAGGLVGTAVGWATFRALDDNVVRVLVGLIAVIYPLSRWILPVSPEPAVPSAVRGNFWSTVGGYTSFIAHAGGPPLMVYLMPLRMDRAIFAATNGVFFAFLNIIKLPPYAMLGQLNAVNLGTAALLIPLIPIGVKVGMWLQGKFTNEQFYRFGQTCIFITGSRLLYDGLRNLGVF
jgi:uncharacterized membrane protein YfcA